MYYFHARYYIVSAGRFLSEDPSGLGPDINPYRYTGNSPTNATDPSGLDWSLQWTWDDFIPVWNVGKRSVQLGDVWWESYEINQKIAADQQKRILARSSWEDLNAVANAKGSTAGQIINDSANPSFKKDASQAAVVIAVLAEFSIQWTAGAGFMFVSPHTGTAYYLRNTRWVSASNKAAPAAEAKAAQEAVNGFINCFPADTPVSTEDGLKSIQAIRPGDRVWAYDLADGQWKLRHVIECFEHEHEGDLVALTVASEVIEATSGHPFWVVRGQRLEDRPRPEHVPETPAHARIPGRWVDAGDLRVGDVLLLKPGRQVPITGLALRQVRQKVYNFHVEELRCYAVGTNQILAHNNSAINNLVKPGGNLIGVAGSNPAIREVAGSTLADAQSLFNQLSKGGTVVRGSTYPGTLVQVPGGGTVGLRIVMTKSAGTIATIDIMNVPGVTGITKRLFGKPFFPRIPKAEGVTTDPGAGRAAPCGSLIVRT